MPPTPPGIPPVGALVGRLELGCFFSSALTGVVLHQSAAYWRKFREDQRWIRILVVVAMMASLAGAGCSIAAAYVTWIDLWNGFTHHALGTPVPGWYYAAQFWSVFMATVTQLFFSIRSHRLVQSWPLSLCLTVLVLTCFTSGCVSLSGAAWETKAHTAVIVWLSCTAFTDALITSILVFKLHNMKTGFEATDDVLGSIASMSLQTGSLCLTFAITQLVLFVSCDDATWAMVAFPFTQVYAMSLLANLNGRIRRRGDLAADSGRRYTLQLQPPPPKQKGSTLPSFPATYDDGSTMVASHAIPLDTLTE